MKKIFRSTSYANQMAGAENIWELPTFCLVTGGGRGLGRSIVINLASRYES